VRAPRCCTAARWTTNHQTILKLIPLKRIAAVMSPRAADRLVQRAGGGLERKVAVLTPGGTAAYLEATGRAGNPRRGKRLDRAHFEGVADRYRLEVASGRRDPVWGVADHFGVARSTAGSWVCGMP
jgi:hypothetical protein